MSTTEAPRALPSVCVVIPAHRRPTELRMAIDAVQEQSYDGVIETIVVFDRAEPDRTLERAGDRPVTVTANARTPGLAGARNTGIVRATTDLVAFCDDDDYWLPGKLAAQVSALMQHPAAVACSTAITVETSKRSTPRLAGTTRVTHEMFVRSRMAMVHSSTLLFPRDALLGALGLIDESIPHSMGEDWDILLRASALHPVVNVDYPLVRVSFGMSYFRRDWSTKIDANDWFLEHYPELSLDDRAVARLWGQNAFSYACDGHRRDAWHWSRRALARDPRQWRAYLASAVAVVPFAGNHVMTVLNRFGRGV